MVNTWLISFNEVEIIQMKGMSMKTAPEMANA
jgi:hypothetical protein